MSTVKTTATAPQSRSQVMSTAACLLTERSGALCIELTGIAEQQRKQGNESRHPDELVVSNDRARDASACRQ
jgi:hypothetical protein